MRGRNARGGVVDLAGDPELGVEIRRAVVAANSLVSRAESIRAYRILPKLFTHRLRDY